MRLKTITLISSLFAISITTTATTRTSIKNGSWSTATTWSPNGTPAENDTIILASPYKVTSTDDISMGTSSGGKLTINSGANLDMGSHNLSFSHNIAVINNGTLSIDKLSLDDAASFTNTGTLTAVQLETNSTSTFTDNGTMTVSTSIEIEASSTFNVGSGITLTDKGSFEDNSSTEITDNGAILVTGTATFDGGTSISGLGYLTGGEIVDNKNPTLWGVAKSYFPCHNCTIPVTGLPIQLMSFTAANTNDAVQLQWATGSEIDNSYFTLSRSTDGVNFTVIATVKGAGKSTTENNYSYIDLSAPAGTNYYRLQQTDYDGTVTTVGTTV
ncbi:MAG TPA: hypothetical protein VNY36_04490, partial [Bacteroidia bacterium]|nr:hypothetical protein [Bacteroidia bacterium]